MTYPGSSQTVRRSRAALRSIRRRVARGKRRAPRGKRPRFLCSFRKTPRSLSFLRGAFREPGAIAEPWPKAVTRRPTAPRHPQRNRPRRGLPPAPLPGPLPDPATRSRPAARTRQPRAFAPAFASSWRTAPGPFPQAGTKGRDPIRGSWPKRARPRAGCPKPAAGPSPVRSCAGTQPPETASQLRPRQGQAGVLGRPSPRTQERRRAAAT